MTGKYSLIYADPPWSYGNTISNGAAADHYSTMKLIDIKRLPVWELAAENAVLAMWYTGTHNQEAIELAEAWGFTVRTMKGFTWVKLNQNAELRINKALAEGEVTDFYDFLDLLNAETRMNGGNHTRANTEDLLIATRGAGLERKHAGIKQVVYITRSERTAKSRGKCATDWNCFTEMFRALSCLAAARRRAGITGEISVPPPRWNCCPDAPLML